MSDPIAEHAEPIRILVIDDDALLRGGMARMLRAAGYDVLDAGNGAQGLETARRHGPDIVVLDVNLPDINGLELCRRIKALPACAESRVAIISGIATTSDEKADGLETGADDYIVRPLSNRELLARIRLLIRLKQADDILKQHKEDLERVVAERTAELRAVNEQLQQEITDHKRAEEALRESEELHRNILLQISDAVFITDDRGDFTFICPNTEHIFGYSVPDVEQIGNIAALFGERLFDLDTLETVNEIINIEREIVDTGCQKHTLLVNVKRVSLKVGTILYTCRDITERKRAEDALRESEERLRTFVNTNPFPIVVTDTEHEKILYWSKSAQELFGYQPKTAAEWFSLAYPDPQYRQEVIDRSTPYLERAQHSKTAVNTGEYQIVCRDGSVKICEIYAQCISGHLVLTNNDITERKQAEMALQKSESLLSQAEEIAEMGSWEWDIENDIAYWSDGLFKIFKRSSQEGAPKWAQQSGFYQKESYEQLSRALEECAKNGTPYDVTVQAIRSDGEIRTCISRGRAQKKHEGEIHRLWGTFHDITERKKTEEALRASEQKYTTLFESLVDEVHIWKLVQDTTGKITGWMLSDANASALKAWKKTKEDVIGKTPNEIFGYDAYTDFMPIVEKIFETGKPYRWERYFEPTDQYLSMDSIPFGDYFISTGRDITERKQAEQALKERENLLRNIIDSSTDYIFVKDRNLKTILCNTTFAQAVNKNPSDLLGKTDIENGWDAELVKGSPEKGIRGYEKDDLEALSGKSVQNMDTATISGKTLFFDSVKIPLKDEHNNIFGVLGISRDITERKRAEEELKRAKDAAEDANRAKSEFLAVMSHEIRTPLHTILGFTKLLDAEIIDPKQRSYLEAIQTSGKTLFILINDVLDLSKIEARKMTIQPEPVRLRRVFEEIQQMFTLRAAQKELDFSVDIADDLPEYVLLDEVRLRQVLFNLVGNAVKFTDAGSVTLAAAASVSECDADRRDLVITIADTGIGIPDAEQQQIFEAFYQQTDQSVRRFGGTGLGLAISARLVELMGGAITVRSVVGQGSVFAVRLPKIPVMADANLPDEILLSGDDHDVSPETDLSPELRAALPEALRQLEQRLLPQWERLQTIQPIKAVTEFGAEVQALGAQYGLTRLSEYGNTLVTAIDHFDIQTMRTTLRDFPTLIAHLKALG